MHELHLDHEDRTKANCIIVNYVNNEINPIIEQLQKRFNDIDESLEKLECESRSSSCRTSDCGLQINVTNNFHKEVMIDLGFDDVEGCENHNDTCETKSCDTVTTKTEPLTDQSIPTCKDITELREKVTASTALAYNLDTQQKQVHDIHAQAVASEFDAIKKRLDEMERRLHHNNQAKHAG